MGSETSPSSSTSSSTSSSSSSSLSLVSVSPPSLTTPRHSEGRTVETTALLFWKALLRDFLKGFSVAFAAKYVLTLLPVLLKIRSHNVTKRLTQAVKLVAEPRTRAWGLLGGWTVASINAILYLTRDTQGFLRRYRGVLAGAVGGFGMAIVPEDSRLNASLFMFVRALEVFARSERVNKYAPKFNHYDSLLFMSSSAALLWVWIFHRGCLPSTYHKFLKLHGGRSDIFYEQLRRLHVQAPVDIEALRKSDPRLVNLNHRIPRKDFFCAMAHPERETCFMHFVDNWIVGLKRAAPVYIPIYVIPLLLFNHKKLLQAPLKYSTRTALGILLSCNFLSLYCSGAWWMVCLCQTRLRVFWHLNGVLGGLGGGAAILVERKGRRIELGLYLLTQALESVYRFAMKKKIVGRVPGGEILMFILSTAIMTHAYCQAPERLRSGYRSGLQMLLGSTNVNTVYKADEVQHKNEDD